MTTSISRRDFVKASVLASAAVPLSLRAAALPSGPLGPQKDTVPSGKIKGVEFSRLMLGGNLISGYAHARDLGYVSDLMKRYNTEAKILETLELAETHGINTLNNWVKDGIPFLQHHWKRGGKMKWIAQVRLGGNGEMDQIKQAADLGAAAIHPTGDTTDALARQGKIETVGRMLDMIRSLKCVAGIGAHGLGSIIECEKAGLKPDFYIKTFHSHEYHTAPKEGETEDLGRYDNSWCSDPDAVAEFMFGVDIPWIAFKVLAAGAIPPQRGFRYAFENGADFILVGMFDWQVVENVQTVKTVLRDVERQRPWRG